MKSDPDVVVEWADFEPYSGIRMTDEEQRLILIAINARIRAGSDRRHVQKARYEELFETVAEADNILQLDVNEHDLLKVALTGSPSGLYLVERLVAAEPDCVFGCTESAVTQIQINGGDPFQLCSRCFKEVESSDPHTILSQLDGEVDESDDILVCPAKKGLNREALLSEQCSLNEFTEE